MDDLRHLEEVVRELITLYEISAPPIPIEGMLQNPHDDMWREIDMTEMSGSFLTAVKTPYALRMSLARFLVRNILRSPWGTKRKLDQIITTDDTTNQFARMIAMPADFVFELVPESRQPDVMSLHFEVPEDDARLRLEELSAYH